MYCIEASRTDLINRTAGLHCICMCIVQMGRRGRRSSGGEHVTVAECASARVRERGASAGARRATSESRTRRAAGARARLQSQPRHRPRDSARAPRRPQCVPLPPLPPVHPSFSQYTCLIR